MNVVVVAAVAALVATAKDTVAVMLVRRRVVHPVDSTQNSVAASVVVVVPLRRRRMVAEMVAGVQKLKTPFQLLEVEMLGGHRASPKALGEPGRTLTRSSEGCLAFVLLRFSRLGYIRISKRIQVDVQTRAHFSSFSKIIEGNIMRLHAYFIQSSRPRSSPSSATSPAFPPTVHIKNTGMGVQFHPPESYELAEDDCKCDCVRTDTL